MSLTLEQIRKVCDSKSLYLKGQNIKIFFLLIALGPIRKVDDDRKLYLESQNGNFIEIITEFNSKSTYILKNLEY